jgi:hypothetical protein
VFPPYGDQRKDVLAKLQGTALLPWEDAVSAVELLPRLRALKRSVLACLVRDPVGRPSIRDVLQCWSSLFDADEAPSTGLKLNQLHGDGPAHA